MGGIDALQLAGRVERHDAGAAATFDDEIEREPLLENRGRAVPHRGHERPLDLGAGGGAAGVQDAGRRVTALTGSRQLAAGHPVEDGAEGDELVNSHGALVDEHADRGLVAEAGSGA